MEPVLFELDLVTKTTDNNTLLWTAALATLLVDCPDCSKPIRIVLCLKTERTCFLFGKNQSLLCEVAAHFEQTVAASAP